MAVSDRTRPLSRTSTRTPHIQRPRCPYCHDDVAPGRKPDVCAACLALQHRECSIEYGGCAACGAGLRTEPPLATDSGSDSSLDTAAEPEVVEPCFEDCVDCATFVDPATGKVQITCPYHERWCAFWISIVALSGLGYVAINFPTGSGLGVQGVAAGLIILCLLMLLGAGVTFHESFSWVRVDDFEAGSVASTGPKIHARERPSSARLGKPQG